MLKDFLPVQIYEAIIKKNNESEINEIHIRADKPITILCNSKMYFLSNEGACSSYAQSIYGTYEMISQIIFNASEFSIYSVNEQIKRGYLIVDGGIRIGICGDAVVDGEIKTIKNYSSICIRVPHMIKNASLPIFNQILSDGAIKNTLILSPPGAGKTTMLRDLVYQLSNHNYPYNVFIADERGELVGGAKSGINLGNFYDSVSFLNKMDAFLLGIRSMSPDIIITDELGAENDFKALEYAVNCGVSIIATVHAKNIEELRQKPEFKQILEKKYFSRFIVLSKARGAGTIEGVYRENLTKIYGGV